MKCGAMNEFDANFCKKCATSFHPSVATAESEELVAKKESIPSRKRKKQTARPQIVAASENENPSDEEVNDEEGDGISVNFVPDIQKLDVEFLPGHDEAIKVNFGDLVAQACAEKARQSH